MTRGTQEYRGFVLDNVLHTADEDDIHFNLYVPESYDGSQRVALFVTLPGYQGLYFQGVGANVRTEDFGFTARDYDPQMIVLAPQLSDWGKTSAQQTIVLVKWMLRAYAIDRQHVYLEGYSGGGETLSLVMGMDPGCSDERFSAHRSGTAIWAPWQTHAYPYIWQSGNPMNTTGPGRQRRRHTSLRISTARMGWQKPRSNISSRSM